MYKILYESGTPSEDTIFLSQTNKITQLVLLAQLEGSSDIFSFQISLDRNTIQDNIEDKYYRSNAKHISNLDMHIQISLFSKKIHNLTVIGSFKEVIRCFWGDMWTVAKGAIKERCIDYLENFCIHFISNDIEIITPTQEETKDSYPYRQNDGSIVC